MVFTSIFGSKVRQQNMSLILVTLEEGKIKIDLIHTKIPSPFAFNLIAQGYMDVLRMEDRLEFIRRLHQAILKEINKDNEIYGNLSGN